MAILPQWKIKFFLLLWLFGFSSARAQVYLGAGVSLSRTAYTSSVYGDNSSSKSHFGLISKIYSSIPSDPQDIQFFIRFRNGDFGKVCELDNYIKDPSSYQLTDSGCVPVNPWLGIPSVFNLASGDEKTAIFLIETDFGRAIGSFFINKLKPDLSIAFDTSKQRNDFYSRIGKKFMAAFMGSSTYTRSQILEKIKSSSLFDTAGFEFASQFNLELGKLTDDEMEDRFKIFQDIMINELNSEIHLAPEKSAVSGEIQLSLLAGIGNLIKNVYFGFEVALDLGKQRTGKNSNNEIQLSSFYTLGLIGKIGYSFRPNSFNYLNLGLAMREYDIKYKGDFLSFSNKVFSPHLLAGVGIEFLLNKSTSIFTELNYLVSMSSIKTSSFNGVTLNPASAQLKIGAKYYFGNHPLSYAGSSVKKTEENNFRKTVRPAGSYFGKSPYSREIRIKPPSDLKLGSSSPSSVHNFRSYKEQFPSKSWRIKPRPAVRNLPPEAYDIEYETKIIIKERR